MDCSDGRFVTTPAWAQENYREGLLIHMLDLLVIRSNKVWTIQDGGWCISAWRYDNINGCMYPMKTADNDVPPMKDRPIYTSYLTRWMTLL